MRNFALLLFAVVALCAIALLPFAFAPRGEYRLSAGAGQSTLIPPVDQAALLQQRLAVATDELDVLYAINYAVNHTMTYQPDIDHYGVTEKWVTLPADGRGDCEDYALSKMELLRRLGVYMGRMKIGLVVVTLPKDPPAGHAVLEYQMADGRIAVLDNNFDEIASKEWTEQHGYSYLSDW